MTTSEAELTGAYCLDWRQVLRALLVVAAVGGGMVTGTWSPAHADVVPGAAGAAASASGPVAAFRWGGNPELDDLRPQAVDMSALHGAPITAASSYSSDKACVVAAGRVYCAADYTSFVAIDPGATAGLPITKLSGGPGTMCMIAGGRAFCQGDTLGNGAGQAASSATPVAVDDTGALQGKTVTDIAVGFSSVCAVADGLPYCWGRTLYGSLGNGDDDPSGYFDRPQPVDVTGILAGRTVTKMVSGQTTTCVLTSGQVACWGADTSGQLGDGSQPSAAIARPVWVQSTAFAGKPVTDLSMGTNTACAVAGGRAYCWGVNGNVDLLGAGITAPQSDAPVRVVTNGALSGKTVTHVEVGDSSSCAIANEAAYCWGDNFNGQTGTGHTSHHEAPVAVDRSGPLGGRTVALLAVTNDETYAFTPPATRLTTGNTLTAAQNLQAANGYRFVMQTDGNAVLYSPAAKALFSTKTAKHPGSRIVMQADGNLVVYSGRTPLWANYVRANGASLVVQTDGNLVEYDRTGRAVWTYRT